MSDAQERVLAAPGANGWSFDPAALVRAVNALAGSDSGEALGTLRDAAEQAAGDPPQSGVVLVALALFVADEPLPAPPFGAPDLPLPPPGPGLERLPLVLEAQLPFLLVGGYRMAGAANVAGWLERCAAAAHPREAPLAPERSPADAVDALTSSPRWAELVPEPHRPRVLAMLRAQALRAAGESPAEADMALADGERWEAAASRTRTLRWDAAQGRFA
jgi:hypothetical protein